MSGTKSPSPKEQAINPAPQALIVAHGQPSDPLPAEASLAWLTTRVQAHLPETLVASATMANPGVLERVIETLPKHAPVYPLFMADGWFVRTALAKRLAGRSLQILPPLGLDLKLPGLAAAAATQAMETSGWQVEDSGVLIAAHGSAQGPAAAKSAYLFAERLAKVLPCANTSVGFVEEEPFLAKAATSLPAQTLCLPFFAMEGEHVRDDIPDALAEAGFTGPVLPPFGKYEDIAKLIADALDEELRKKNAA